MRTLTDHKVNGLNEAIKITAQDNPGPGGANHIYQLDLVGGAPLSGGQLLVINFQNGPINEEGFNGFTNEALLAVLIDRMRGLQYERNGDGSFNFNSRGKYACKENAQALTYMEETMMWLQKRTRDRMAAGIEGTMQVGPEVGTPRPRSPEPRPPAVEESKPAVDTPVDFTNPKLREELNPSLDSTAAEIPSAPPQA